MSSTVQCGDPTNSQNMEFRSLHEYYTIGENNPLKKKQLVIAISCKLIRVFYAILASGVTYDLWLGGMT